VNTLIGRKQTTSLPSTDDNKALVDKFCDFFISKIAAIQQDLSSLQSTTVPLSCPPVSSLLQPSTSYLNQFSPVSESDVEKCIKNSPKTSCQLDPIPTKLLLNILPAMVPIITDIINKCFSSGEFPAPCKSAIVRPLLKKPSLDCEVLKNYRPVSNLSYLSKTIERVISSQLVEYMKDNHLLEGLQSAYKAGHSTETALLRIHNDLLCGVEKASAVSLVLLDLSAAFDTVDHSTFLSLLESHFGIKGKALQLLRSYLHGRTQCVAIENVQSEVVSLMFGVPQGSVLGPAAFSMYTVPLGAILRHHKIGYHIYADDTQLYLCTDPKNPSSSLDQLRTAISDIRTWMITNKLKINDDKTEFLVITKPHLTSRMKDLKIKIGGHDIPATNSAKNLGVIFDQTLSMEKQINSVSRANLFHLRNISNVRRLLSDSASSLLIHSLVTARLDYCNILYHGLPKKLTKKLQRIQNIAARIQTQTSSYDDVTQILFSLHWLPVRARAKYKLLITAFKAVNGQAPKYISNLIQPYVPAKSLRSKKQGRLVKPDLRLDMFGRRSFAYAAPHEWNNLPVSLKTMTSFPTFKQQLKSLLFKQYYCNQCE